LLTRTSGIPDYYDEEKVDDFDNFTVDVPWYELKGPRDYLSIFPGEAMKFPPQTIAFLIQTVDISCWAF
jgi:hypothetical protein